jgi:hypothetical protein
MNMEKKIVELEIKLKSLEAYRFFYILMSTLDSFSYMTSLFFF